MSTDSDWEKFGKSNPYFGVLTHEKYRSSALTKEAKDEFFDTGSAHVAAVLGTIAQRLGRTGGFTRVLDFGCGVGRILIPLAGVATEAVGVDVSDSMLAEAAKNCRERSVSNVTLVKSDDELSRLSGSFDLIHSCIVFQHIPVARGERIFEVLVGKIRAGGVGVLHLTYAKTRVIGRREKLKTRLRQAFPLLVNLENLRAGRRFSEPVMQMNPYDLNRLFFILQAQGVTSLYVEYTDHGGELGVVVYFMKP